MAEIIKLLVVEDEITNAILLKRILSKAGYSVVVAHNGSEALKHIETEQFDAVLTDWMMPQIDGIELIRQIREKIKPVPLIIMVTALVSEGARSYALESGADDYIAKPIDVEELLTRLKDGMEKHRQLAPNVSMSIVTRNVNVTPPFPAVVIGTSTGGPPTIIEIFRNLDNSIDAAFFIVQHGPPWMLDTFSQRLERETRLPVQLANNGFKFESGNVYIAPGDKHLRIDPVNFKILLNDGPKENFVRPAADPLFRSASDAFGKYLIGVVLTGLGRDGSQGSMQIAATGGLVIVQDPETAVAPSMPQAVISLGIRSKVVPLSDISRTISENVFKLSTELKQKIKNQ